MNYGDYIEALRVLAFEAGRVVRLDQVELWLSVGPQERDAFDEPEPSRKDAGIMVWDLEQDYFLPCSKFHCAGAGVRDEKIIR